MLLRNTMCKNSPACSLTPLSGMQYFKFLANLISGDCEDDGGENRLVGSLFLLRILSRDGVFLLPPYSN